jgi:RloB-like protein
MGKIRKPRPFERNILIVCEDTNTAPNYLYGLKKVALAEFCWDCIEIHPKPPLDTEGVIQPIANNPHKTPRKKRLFIEANTEEWLDFEIETAYREQPVVYVRTAQKALEDGSFSEAWAVFDLDGHTGHAKAAVTANNKPTVHIAFSSRSIELWFLLHFDFYNTVFNKVHCKDNRGRELDCNNNLICLDDGRGDCLMGFLRRNTTLSDYKKKMDIFPKLQLLSRTAILNATALRQTYAENQVYYERNPYTTMDFLVKRLLKWINLGESVSINGFQLTVQQTSPSIVLSIQNTISQRQVIQKQHFIFDEPMVDFNISGQGVFDNNESRLIHIQPIFDGSSQLKLKFPANNERDFIWVLC